MEDRIYIYGWQISQNIGNHVSQQPDKVQSEKSHPGSETVNITITAVTKLLPAFNVFAGQIHQK